MFPYQQQTTCKKCGKKFLLTTDTIFVGSDYHHDTDSRIVENMSEVEDVYCKECRRKVLKER